MCCCKLLSSLNVDLVFNRAFLLDNMDENICRLCLQTITNNNGEAVEESLLKSLKLDLKICKKNVMCIECANSLQVLSNFPAGSVRKRDDTLPLSYLENSVKSDPEQVETTSNPKSFIEPKIKCRFCTKTCEREDLISLRVSKENKFLLEQYILEKKNTGEFLTCDACREALEGVLSVTLKCLKVEEKISKYIELKGTDDKGQVELKKVQHFTFRPLIKLETESFSLTKLEERCDQIQEEYTTMDATEIKDEKQISNTELIIKAEDVFRSEQSDCDITFIKTESNCDRFQDHNIPNDPSHMPMDTSETRKCKERIEPRLLTHNSPKEVEMIKCNSCSFKTRHKSHLSRHLLAHKSPLKVTLFECDLCLYRTKHKQHLKQHLLAHKSPSEIEMFKCNSCSYKTIIKYSLTSHLLVHKSPSEMNMLRCKLCPFETKYRKNLKSHLLIHKSPSEINMFKCNICAFETIRKQQLKRHFKTHKSSAETEMFKCAICSHETRYKSGIKRHLLTHENRLPIKTSNLLSHKDPSEINMLKCTLCSFEAKDKFILKGHLLTHKNPSEIQMFKCDLCSYEAKRKCSLKEHVLIHQNPEAINMIKCELCPYKAKRRSDFRKHTLTHKSPSEIKMFQCELCSYQARRKYGLKTHLLTHKNPVKLFI